MYPYTGGYRHIECQGSETTLAECDIGLISHLQQCDYVAVVRQCSNGIIYSQYKLCNVEGKVGRVHGLNNSIQNSK